ncbi:MAG TPA: phosphatidylserine decarboxylase family protein [Syntrophomonadaceae bacterium]|nr:phosphatidylserine decarboxylase family protein [Syntrophomonadaceae bacterium]
MKHNCLIAREGWIFVATPAIITVVLLFTPYYRWSLIPLVLTLFCTFFFRNPERRAEAHKGLVLSPADGTVMEVKRVQESSYLQGEALQVRIFLSIFNVHINRSPLDGQVEWVERSGGLFLPAYKPEAGEKNARNCLGIVSEYGKVLVIQITGRIARRIVCWVKPGDVLQSGERFGLIRFGSCTELFLPTTASIEVARGDKVRGGETVIARFL